MKKIVLSLTLVASLYADHFNMPKTTNTTYQNECGSCHMAFQPSFLNQGAWKKIMLNLNKHFEVDASLEQVDQQTILQYLMENANSRLKNPNNEISITKLPWFMHEHKRLQARATANPKIKTLSNCMACHTRADKNDYDEDNVRIPR